MEPRISLITLGVADLDRSRRFYEALGFRASSVGEDRIYFFQAGPVGLIVWSRPELAKDAGVAESGSGFRSIAIAHNVRAKGDVDAVLAEVGAAGGHVTQAAHDADWGGRSGYFADPDGHLWEVAWNPALPIGPDGAVTLPP